MKEFHIKTDTINLFCKQKSQSYAYFIMNTYDSNMRRNSLFVLLRSANSDILIRVL